MGIRTKIYTFLAILTIALSSAEGSYALEISVSCPSGKVWSEKPAPITGLTLLAVVPTADGSTISLSGLSQGTKVKWLRFSNMGAAYAEEVPASDISYSNDGSSSLKISGGDYGYVAETEKGNQYVWIVDYSRHRFSVSSLSISEQSDCGTTVLDVSGNGAPINYYTINGRQTELSRGIKLYYRTNEYSEEKEVFESVDKLEELSHFNNIIQTDAPTESTDFKLTGDRFLEFWGTPEEAVSSYYQAIAVNGHTTAVQKEHESDNMIGGDEGEEGLGGSAPCEITFQAAVTEAAVFKEWQFSASPEFEDIMLSFPQETLEYTFNDQGTTYVRFMAADNSGNCTWESPVYTVSIGESRLLCPNAFSPRSTPGVNDIWKVSYKSLVSFECHIFNSRGVEIFSFTNPDDGWDGRYKTKYVPAGVYYYVIQAKGSDGKEYKLGGDINIVDFHGPENSGGGETE